MKKRLAAMALAGVMMAGLGTPAAAYGAVTKTVESAQKTEFVFMFNETEIAMNAEAKPVLSALGKEEKYFEAASCAFQGIDKTYTYKGFELTTYPRNGKDYIQDIYFLDDTVATAEGIKIGSSKKDMEKAYGKEYKEDGGFYTYTVGKSQLIFHVGKAGTVDQVEYAALTE